MYSKVLIPTLLATGVFANVAQLARRQDGTSLDLGSLATLLPSGCDLAPFISLTSDLPSLPTGLPEITDPCNVSLNEQQSSEYSSFTSAIESYYNAHSSELSSIAASFLSNCPLASEAAPLLTQSLDELTAFACSTGAPGASGSSATTTTSTGTTRSTGGVSATGNNNGAAMPVATPFVGAVIAGAVGLMAAL